MTALERRPVTDTLPDAELYVREARAADGPAWIDLYEAVAGEGRWIAGELPVERGRFAAAFRARLSRADTLQLVAEAGGTLVGQLSADRSHHGFAELGMAVAADWRRRGVGSALLQACVDWARGSEIHKLALQVWPHNEAAIALYRKFGFEEEGFLKSHYRRANGELWDIVVMGLLL